MPDTPQQNTPQNTPPPASTTPERPSWLPEGVNTPEDFRSRYDDINQRLTTAEATSKRWERWGDPDQFERNLAQRLTERDKKLRADWDAEHRRQQDPTEQRDPYENWEMLDPRQQAATLAQQITQAVLGQLNGTIDQRWNEAQGRLGDFDQRMNLVSRALMDRAGNPDLDLNKLWQEANNLATGDVNKLYELAIDRATAPARLQKQIEQAVSAEKQKWEQEQKNREQAALTGPGNGTTAVSFKDTINARQASRNGNKDSLKQRILQKGISEGWFHPSQI